MAKITVDLPDDILEKLQLQNQTLQTIFMEVIKTYLEEKTLKHASNTWELCGSFEVTENNPINHKEITNYAETLDQDLY